MRTIGLAFSLFLGLLVSMLLHLDRRGWDKFRNPSQILDFESQSIASSKSLAEQATLALFPNNPGYEKATEQAQSSASHSAVLQKSNTPSPRQIVRSQARAVALAGLNSAQDSIPTADFLAALAPATGAALDLPTNQGIDAPLLKTSSTTLAETKTLNQTPAKQDFLLRKPSVLSFNSGYLWRSQNNQIRTLQDNALAASSLGAGYTGAEATLRLGQKWAGTASIFTGLQENLVDRQTAQAAFALRWTPLSTLNAHLSAGRLVKAGAKARNAWVMRASAGAGDGYDAPQGKQFWTHWHSYGDVTLIGANTQDVLATGAARFGAGIAVNPRTALFFTLGGETTLQHVERTTSLAEIGPSVLVRWRPGPENLLLDMRLGYRHKIAGNSADNNGVQLFIGLNY
jgi:Bacteriophage N adsorption protein A C-term